jgi:hypothetical protein
MINAFDFSETRIDTAAAAAAAAKQAMKILRLYVCFLFQTTATVHSTTLKA